MQHGVQKTTANIAATLLEVLLCANFGQNRERKFMSNCREREPGRSGVESAHVMQVIQDNARFHLHISRLKQFDMHKYLRFSKRASTLHEQIGDLDTVSISLN